MKVCASPIPFEPDYSNYDFERVRAQEDEHRTALKARLVEMGYKGPHTGEILRVPFADGAAQYMFADAKRQSCLIHLPYGDAWNSPDVRFLPKTEVLRRIAAERKLAAFFASKKSAAA